MNDIDIQYIKKLESRIETLEDSLSKMQVCAMIIKKITQNLSGVDIDKEMEKELSIKK